MPLSRPCCSKICLINTPGGTSCPGIPPPPLLSCQCQSSPMCGGSSAYTDLGSQGRSILWWKVRDNGARHSLHSTSQSVSPTHIASLTKTKSLHHLCLCLGDSRCAILITVVLSRYLSTCSFPYTSSLVLFWICIHRLCLTLYEMSTSIAEKTKQ